MEILPKEEAFDAICYIALFRKGFDEKGILDFAQDIDSVLMDEDDYIVLIRGEDKEQTDVHRIDLSRWNNLGQCLPEYVLTFEEYPKIFDFFEKRLDLNNPSPRVIRAIKEEWYWLISVVDKTFRSSDCFPGQATYFGRLLEAPLFIAETEWVDRKNQMFESWMQTTST